MFWTIFFLVIIAMILFALGWGIGYRLGFAEGDGRWRAASGTGYAVIDERGRLVKVSPDDLAALDAAVRGFKKGKPARVVKGGGILPDVGIRKE